MVNIKKGFQKIKENLKEAKSQPRSKRKSLLLGFATVLGIFGLIRLALVLPAVAQDIPNNTPDVSPGPIGPNQKPSLVSSQQIINGLAGAAGTICGLAITSGSFMVGIVCGVIVVVGILKANGQ